MMCELISGRCENKKKSCAIIQDSYPGKGSFVSFTQNGSTENFEITFFYIPNLKKQNLEFSRFVAVVFSIGKTSRRSSDPSSSHPKNNVFLGPQEVSLTQNGIAENKKRWMLRFLVRFVQNVVLKFLIEPFWIAAPKSPFSRTQILEKSTWPVLNFCNGQKLVQIS